MKTIILTLTAPSVTPFVEKYSTDVFSPLFCFENNAAFCKTEVIFGDLVEWPKKKRKKICVYMLESLRWI